MYHVDVVNSGDYSFQVKSKGYEFVVDIKGNGVTPPDALLASLGSCVGVYIRKYAEGANLALGEFAISVDADFCKESPMRFKNINISIDLKGAAFDKRRQMAILDFVKNCPVHNTLKNNPEVSIKIT